jgi:hypothetical protein
MPVKPTLHADRADESVMIMSRKDPIIEEIHAVREEMARKADYDIEKILEAARARQVAGGRCSYR